MPRHSAKPVSLVSTAPTAPLAHAGRTGPAPRPTGAAAATPAGRAPAVFSAHLDTGGLCAPRAPAASTGHVRWTTAAAVATLAGQEAPALSVLPSTGAPPAPPVLATATAHAPTVRRVMAPAHASRSGRERPATIAPLGISGSPAKTRARARPASIASTARTNQDAPVLSERLREIPPETSPRASAPATGPATA